MLLSVLPGGIAAQQPGAPGARDTVRQRDLMDVLSRVLHGKPKLSDSIVIPPKMVLTILPAISANPTNGLLLGVSGNAVTRFGPEENTNLSTVSASVNYTTKKQFNVLLRSNVYTPRNGWKFEGDWRYLDSNQPTYGLGPALPEDRKSPMDYNLIRFYETVYRGISQDFLVGLGYHLNYYFGIVDHNAAQGIVTPYVQYSGGQPTSSTSSGLSFNVLSDTRDNPLNTRNGLLARGSLHFLPRWMGSDATWQSLETELKTYHKVGGRNVLAFWGLAWLTMGQPPYLDLPAIGWDYNNRSGRGYAQGRIRARDMVYGEAEYRMTLSRDGLLGAVAFFNVTSTNDAVTGALQTPDPGGGVGLRLKLNKNSNTNIGIDFGVGAEGSKGVFFGTGEAF
ncbi:MAG TPA: BamA/TamA family outer membrane protein [Gemmatimonadales bacterium]|nr:BamA/TamA family outer membrane protein [Gemmatimonadales bacterium]